MAKISFWLFLPVLFSGVLISPLFAGDSWFTSIYAGRFSNNAFHEIIRSQTKFEDSDVYVLSVGKELCVWKKHLGMELEGQIGTHNGIQDHSEVNASFTLRWLTFPWDRYLDTSLAYGNGLSFAFERPALEKIHSDDDNTSQLLYYFLAELAVTVPKLSKWDVFLRIHHRSSAWRLVGGYLAGSNFVGMGLRYRFNKSRITGP